MCIDGKTQALAKRLTEPVLNLIDNVEVANSMIQENIRTADSEIARMAELYFENPVQFHIRRELDQVRRHRGTKLSALRGAIVLVLQEYVKSEQAKVDETLPQFELVVA